MSAYTYHGKMTSRKRNSGEKSRLTAVSSYIKVLLLSATPFRRPDVGGRIILKVNPVETRAIPKSKSKPSNQKTTMGK
jgi:hypothetical protein